MTARRKERMQAVLDKRQTDLTAYLDCVHKPHNLSAIQRTCDAVGIKEVHCTFLGENEYRTHNHSSAGIGKWVDVVTHDSTPQGMKHLQDKGYKIYAAHLSDRAVDYRSVDYTRPCAVLLGAEKWGVSEEASDLADEHIIIPMIGLGQSLNVSVAAAIVLYEAQRQRQEKGFYDQVQLDEETYKNTLFEWMQPVIAERCRKDGRPYPELDEDGHPIDYSEN